MNMYSRLVEILVVGLLTIALVIIVIGMLDLHKHKTEKTGQDLNEIRKQAISLGYAYYNPTNGLWQWKTNNLPK